MAQRFPHGTGLPAPDTANHEGFPAYTPDLRERIAECLMLGTFGNSFYASGRDLAAEAVDVLRRGVTEAPRFVAQAAVLAREEGYVRSAPIVALGLLTADGTEAKGYARAIFGRIIRTGDDLRNFVAFIQSEDAGRKFGGLAQRLVRDWLILRLDEYQAIKYAGSGERLSLRNILRMTHPKATEPWRNEVFAWLVRGEVGENVTQIRALEALAKGDMPPAAAVSEGRLPFEAVMPRVPAGDRATWAALLPHAPYMMLLRSLNAFGRAGVWSDRAALEYACRTVADPERVQKSMQFPFRFLQAAEVLQRESAPQELVNAVFAAGEASVGNLPSLGQGVRMALAPDVSGSMSMAAVSKDVTASGVAGVFTAALWKANPTATVLPFGTAVHQIRASSSDSILTVARAIQGIGGGGTDLAAPVEWLTAHRRAVDVLVGLTDSEDWAGRGFLAAWTEYRRTLAPKAQAVLVQLIPNQAHVAPTNHPGVRYVFGWSDAVLRYVADVAAGRTMRERIEAVEV